MYQNPKIIAKRNKNVDEQCVQIGLWWIFRQNSKGSVQKSL